MGMLAIPGSTFIVKLSQSSQSDRNGLDMIAHHKRERERDIGSQLAVAILGIIFS